MLSIQLHILPGMLVGLCLSLVGLLLRGADLTRRPVMFGQATVISLDGGRASFRLFDGQILELAVGAAAQHRLRVGDYGRLTYRAGRFLRLEP